VREKKVGEAWAPLQQGYKKTSFLKKPGFSRTVAATRLLSQTRRSLMRASLPRFCADNTASTGALCRNELLQSYQCSASARKNSFKLNAKRHFSHSKSGAFSPVSANNHASTPGYAPYAFTHLGMNFHRISGEKREYYFSFVLYQPSQVNSCFLLLTIK
jgi:hypothetical protein